MHRRALLVVLVGASWICAVEVQAQQTGGSFGGSDFGGGGAGDTSGGSDYGSADYGSVDYGSSSDGSGSLLWALAGVMLGLAVGGFVIYRSRTTRRRGGRVGGARGRGMSLGVLWLGIDWRSRRDVQDRLANLAESGRAGSSKGRHQLLVGAVRALRDAQIGWLYAGIEHRSGLAEDDAEPAFHGVATEAKQRYRYEVVRDGDGSVRRNPAPAQRAHSDEGEGIVVVTVVVVARSRWTSPGSPADASAIDAMLQKLVSVSPNDLVAVEVVWSPADENDRMSSAELEALYPEVTLIDESSLAGRVRCAYCRAPFAAELRACPRCGAPVDDAGPSRE